MRKVLARIGTAVVTAALVLAANQGVAAAGLVLAGAD